MNDGCDTLQGAVAALVAACGSLVTRALESLPLDLAYRLAEGAASYVVLRLGPLTAGVFAEANGGAVQVAEVTNENIPPELDAAASAYVAGALAGLQPETADQVRGHLRARTGRLSIVVTAWPRSVDLLLHHGPDQGTVLVRVVGDEGRAH